MNKDTKKMEKTIENMSKEAKSQRMYIRYVMVKQFGVIHKYTSRLVPVQSLNFCREKKLIKEQNYAGSIDSKYKIKL